MPITRKPFGYRDGTILWRTRAEQEKAVAEIAKVRNGFGRAHALGLGFEQTVHSFGADLLNDRCSFLFPSVIPNRRVRTVD